MPADTNMSQSHALQQGDALMTNALMVTSQAKKTLPRVTVTAIPQLMHGYTVLL